ncbi:MAG: FecR domain-containing protein [archaeon]|nr:FecR domain-containing protein [archaeon]
MSTGKKVLIGLGIFALLVVIAVFFIYKSLIGSATVTAQLNVESGQVLVNGMVAADGTRLKQRDIIETGADGQATVILYESVLVSLEPGTKITLDDLTRQHPQITQDGGETWSKFTKLSGVEEYSVKTGNSVASVRGTAFGISNNMLIVGEGNVGYDIDGESFEAGEDEVVVNENGKRIKRIANAEERAKIAKGLERSLQRMKYMRELELAKNKFLVNRLKVAKGWNDEDIKKFLENADDGKENIDDLVDQSPVRAEGIQKIADHTREIRKLRDRIRQLQNLSVSSPL